MTKCVERLVALIVCVVGVHSACAAKTPQGERPPAGTEIRGDSGYVRYTVGDLPLILGAPHGGTLEPAGIPDRISVTGSRYDTNSLELARAIVEAFRRRTGKSPHLVITTVHRKKLDTNRDVLEAAQDDPIATHAWEEYHGFIDRAKEYVVKEFGSGLYIDVHGHRHPHAYLELGYLLVDRQLALPDDSLNLAIHVQQSSVRALVESTSMTLAELVRGPRSLGSLYERQGYHAVPSERIPHSNGDQYFSGGYNTERHGSRDGGTISAIQLETPWIGVRDTPQSRRSFADASVDVLLHYLTTYFHYKGSGS